MGNAGITLRKLEFDEIVNRWDELKLLSKKALNDEKNVTGLGDRFQVAISRFFLLCEQETAQIWVSQENGIDCYLCLTFVGNSAMTFDKGLTIYAATKFKNNNVKDKQKHWLFFLNGICDFAKSKKCKKPRVIYHC